MHPWHPFYIRDCTKGVLKKTRWWFQIFLNCHPYLGKWSNLTSIFFKWVGSTTNLKTTWIHDIRFFALFHQHLMWPQYPYPYHHHHRCSTREGGGLIYPGQYSGSEGTHGVWVGALVPLKCWICRGNIAPRTQMTLVLIGKGIFLGGFDLQQIRGHWGSRRVHTLSKFNSSVLKS